MIDPTSIGMIAGSLAGAGGGYLESREQKKAAQAARPRRRRLASMQEAVNQAADMRQRALIALAQAHMDYASQF